MSPKVTGGYLFLLLSLLLFFLAPAPARALEPVTALDDGFAVPSSVTMSEAVVTWPGSEALAGGTFAGIAWSAPYGMRDLAVTTASAGTRIGRVGVSGAWSGTDFDLYVDDHETFGISYAFGGRFAAGVRVSRSAMRIEGFGTDAAVSADAGFVFRPVESLVLAAGVEDLAEAELGASREPLDGRSRVSLAWTIPGAFTLLVSGARTRRADFSLSAGALVEAAPSLRIGVLGANAPDRVEFLAALDRKNVRFSYRGAFHRDLGFTHGFSVGWTRVGRGDTTNGG